MIETVFEPIATGLGAAASLKGGNSQALKCSGIHQNKYQALLNKLEREVSTQNKGDNYGCKTNIAS